MDLQLANKKIAIAGASRGIGYSIASHFVNEGADISICARGKESLDTAVKALSSNKSNQVVGSVCDLSIKEDVFSWVKSTKKALSGLDCLVINASAMATGSELDNWKASFELDLMSAVNLVKSARPYLEKSSSPSILIISSTAAVENAVDLFEPEEVGPYGVFKAALINYAASLSTTLAPKGIRVNTISPGAVEFEDGVWDKIKKSNPDLYQKAIKRCRLGKLSKPEDVAYAALFLCSPLAGNITGTNLIIDGGSTRRVQF